MFSMIADRNLGDPWTHSLNCVSNIWIVENQIKESTNLNSTEVLDLYLEVKV